MRVNAGRHRGVTLADAAPERKHPAPETGWRPYALAAIAIALVGGFGLGAALFAARLTALPLGRWWPAAAQAHGHLQVFGWGGLMVLGIGLHFLPRLRGANDSLQGRTAGPLALLLTGLILRVPTQIAAASEVAEPGATLARAGLVLSGLLELAGGIWVLILGARLIRYGPPLPQRPGFTGVLPIFLTVFVGLLTAFSLNVGGTVIAAGGTGLLPAELDGATLEIGLTGFLVPAALAMAARLFPLHLRTRPAGLAELRVGVALIAGGLALRLVAEAAGWPSATAIGRALVAAGLLVGIVSTRVFARRRSRHRDPRALADPIQWHALTAFGWLGLAAGLATVRAAAAFGADPLPGVADAERHAVGAGFVTVLILGFGQVLLPGFAGRPQPGREALWATLISGNAAAALRVAAPLAAGSLPAGGADMLGAIGGSAGLAAILVFAIAIGGTLGFPTAADRARASR